MDLLKSALEISQGKAINSMLRKDEKTSDQSLRSSHAGSTPKLFNQLGRNISGFAEVLNEVILSILFKPSLNFSKRQRIQ